MPLDRRVSPSGNLLVELHFSGHITTVPERRSDMSAEDRVWLRDVADPELYRVWERLRELECSQQRRRDVERQKAERARVIDWLDRRRVMREVAEGPRRRLAAREAARRRRYKQLAFSFPSESERHERPPVRCEHECEHASHRSAPLDRVESSS
jgi:hypothetical protein